jgi:delta 1-pyrroline-5-carboxylate dehydrogenase
LLIVLLDADIIIDLHKFGIWDTIAKRNEILIPSTVLRREAYYYEDELGYKHSIELLNEAGKTFTEASATVKEIFDFKHKFVRFIEEELDPGETEALKILNDRDDCSFCTCFLSQEFQNILCT